MLSYADRLQAMRETKIRHTLQKREQNGYTDLDDFGTVPITPEYEVEPWYNSSNGSFRWYVREFLPCDRRASPLCRPYGNAVRQMAGYAGQLSLRFDTLATCPIMENGICSGVVVESANGCELFEALIVIDATGDASVMHRAGVPTVEGHNYHPHLYGRGCR